MRVADRRPAGGPINPTAVLVFSYANLHFSLLQTSQISGNLMQLGAMRLLHARKRERQTAAYAQAVK